MSRGQWAESSITEVSMSRTASRAGSISTVWSSADVPFCLDPRVQSHVGRSHRNTDSISHQSYQSSIDFAKMSIDIPNEYPRRPDSIRISPPRGNGSNGSSPSRIPSIGIGTISEHEPSPPPTPATSSETSGQPTMPMPRFLTSRFSEDTVDEPPLPLSSSQDTFGLRLAVPHKISARSSSLTSASEEDATPSSTVDTLLPVWPSKCTDLPSEDMACQSNEPPSIDLYKRAYRYFDRNYTVQAESSSSIATLGEHLQPTQLRASLSRTMSEVSHDGSVPSCSRSQGSFQTSSCESTFTLEAETALHQTKPLILDASQSKSLSQITYADLSRHDTEGTPTQEVGNVFSISKDSALMLPSIPTLHSFNSNLTVTSGDPASTIRRRPSTADVYSTIQSLPPSSSAATKLHVPLPTDKVRYQVRSFDVGSSINSAHHIAGESHSQPVNATVDVKGPRHLRFRVASAPRLRGDSSSRFFEPSRAPPVPPVPVIPVDARRPSTAQTDGRAQLLFGRRLRSRTLGEADASATVATHSNFSRKFSFSPLKARSPSDRPSLASLDSSSAASLVPSLLPTPKSATFSAVSPATTNSSLPVTPKTESRPKSRGSSGRAASAGWASYLHSGLILHLEQDNGRVARINMSYLTYDPFGRPEQLVEGSEATRVTTPKRPKSRGDKDHEAEQSGTLEFGPNIDSLSLHSVTFDMSRKAGGPVLKHLTVAEDTKADLLTRQASLALKSAGVQQVSGYERKGRLAWKFVYRVEADEHCPDMRTLVPVRFSCSATLLNPDRARKSRILTMVKKQMVATLASSSIAGSPRGWTHDPALDTAYLSSPASSHQSRKQLANDSNTEVRASHPAASRIDGRPDVNRRYDVIGHSSTSSARLASQSLRSGDSSISQPITPIRGISDSSVARARLQTSPVAAHFGQRSPIRGEGGDGAATNSGGQPLLPGSHLGLTGMASAHRLLEKISMGSLTDSSMGSGNVQHAKPMYINGRKLVPISLPPQLTLRARIDPKALQANVIEGPLPDGTSQNSARLDRLGERSTSMHSPASSQVVHRSASGVDGLRGVTSAHSRCRTKSSGSSRPPTASENIKMEYLSRKEASPVARDVPHIQHRFVSEQLPSSLRHSKPSDHAILTPSSFADESRQARRHRSRTLEGRTDFSRPFTADAWSNSQYPLIARGASAAVLPESSASAKSGRVDQRVDVHTSSSPDRTALGFDGASFKPLPAPPRPSSRPRTAQSINKDSAVPAQEASLSPVPPRNFHIRAPRATHILS